MTYDVVVLGTGAAGLTAALSAATAGASVGLFEKSDRVGGTTALSGGVVWLPDNGLGVGDSREQALTYLDALGNGTVDPALAAAFVDGVDDLLAWLAKETPVRLRLVPRYPDYHPEHPGGRPGGGRSLEPDLISTTPLGDHAARIVGEPRRLRIGEIPSGGGTGVLAPEVLAERTAGRLEGLGRGLVVGLLRGCLEHGVEPALDRPARDLLVEDGRVVGVRFADGAVRARAVVLATGGFEWDAGLVGDFLRGPLFHPPGVPTNTGDGLRMAMRLGARLGNMREAWWVPVVVPPGGLPLLLLRERTVPGTLMVNRAGVRFANEAANYNALGAAFHAFDPTSFSYANIPAWLVLDGRCVRTYGCFGTAPGQDPPPWLVTAPTLTDLAAAIDVPAGALTATVDRWNAHAAAGHDPDFHRGESVYDGWCGDQTHYGTPRATLGPVGEPPFYATRVHPSTLGTKGGPRTTVDGQVLDVDGRPVPGLYAVGNVAAAPTGMVYGGAGGTLGPAMVFAHKAGRAAFTA